ncbi:hypothetical protein [Paraburkholderia sediminicola]|uniref:hypothetical protein n=1 Tax=Paraburkholderia sediminicola TaxID=458836 RepID=UPI0038B6FEE4
MLLRAGPFKDRAGAAKAIAKVRQAGFGNPEQGSATGHVVHQLGYMLDQRHANWPCAPMVATPEMFISTYFTLDRGATITTRRHENPDGIDYVVYEDGPDDEALYRVTDTLAACERVRQELPGKR